MNPQVAQEAFQVVSNVTTTVARELIVGRKEERLVEKRAEKDKRIAELEARKRSQSASAPSSVESSSDPDGSGSMESRAEDMASRIRSRVEETESESDGGGGGGSVNVSLDPLFEDEHCSMCVTILESVASMEPDKRAVGLAEYGRMKQAVDDGADAGDVRDFIEGTDVLSEALSDLRS